MKVKILVEFEVESEVPDLDLLVAGEAAEQAACHHGALTNTGESLVDEVSVHVDGFGRCTVKLVD